MELMCCIKVKDLRFYSYHGFYQEEQILGNEYFVSIETLLPLQSQLNDNLENTLNYESLYEIAKTEMKRSQKLLETVASNILHQALKLNSNIEKIKVEICKINPPFGGDKAKSEIELTWTREINKK
jgi:dihydroneopterin aldolase